MNMDRTEIKGELLMSYDELVDYLLDKYGPVEGDYFCNESCRSKNKIICRGSEGTQCHHIDEDKVAKLSDRKCAIFYPYEYQKADRLVYCNVLEHLLLHMKIALGPRSAEADEMGIPSEGGVFSILAGINDYYGGYEFKREYEKKIYAEIANNFEEYIGILIYFLLSAGKISQRYATTFSKENICRGYRGDIIKKVYDRL